MRKSGLALGLLAVGVVGGLVWLASGIFAASGTLGIGAPWGPVDQDPSDPLRVEVTYSIKANGNVSASTVQAVQDAVDEWNSAIDGREDGWAFDLVPFGASSTASSGGPPSFSHNPNAPPNHGGGGGNGDGGGGDGPDIEIQIKKGGGVIAGSAHSSFENGFRVRVKIQISGASFGSPNSNAVVNEIALHELGHGLSLRHHSNQLDLMGRTVGYEGGGPSSCDLDGFVAAHHWLAVDNSNVPHGNHVSSIAC